MSFRSTLLCLGIVIVTTNAKSESLVGSLERFFGPAAGPLIGTGQGSFNTSFALSAPANSLIYEFDVDTGLPTSKRGSLGPIYTPRAASLGKGKFNFASYYIHQEFTEVDGIEIADGNLSVPVSTPFGPALASIDAEISSQTIAFTASYGVTDNLDVTMVLPSTKTDIDIDLTVNSPFGNITSRLSESATGLSDPSLIARYIFLQSGRTSLGALMAVSLPLGDEDDFHGIGGFRFQPQLIGGHSIGRFGFHGNVGFDIGDTDDAKNEFRYRTALTTDITERVTLATEVLGRVIIDDERLDISSTPLNPIDAGSHSTDVSIGLKYNIFGNVVVAGNALIPLADTGFQTDVTGQLLIEISL